MIYNNTTVTMLSVLSVLLFAVMANTAITYAQKVPTNTQQTPPLSSSSSIPRLHTVKITSPIKGQQVLVGKNLTISGITGTAARNIALSHCQVSIIANGIKPYQPAIGSGHSGAADYSKWNFVLSSKYATIKQGPNNKITAKYTCSNNPTAVSFYSVNVTGRATLTSVAGSHTINPSTTATATVSNQKERPVAATGNNSVGVDSTIASTSSALHSTKLVYLGISKLPSLSHNHVNTAIDQGNSTPTSTNRSVDQGSTISDISTKSEFSPNVFPFGP
jgi:hypothetical protein